MLPRHKKYSKNDFIPNHWSVWILNSGIAIDYMNSQYDQIIGRRYRHSRTGKLIASPRTSGMWKDQSSQPCNQRSQIRINGILYDIFEWNGLVLRKLISSVHVDDRLALQAIIRQLGLEQEGEDQFRVLFIDLIFLDDVFC